MLYLSLKALHLILAVAAFAGIFYLPRILVYLAECREPVVKQQLLTMGARLYKFTNLLLILMLLAGIALILQQSEIMRQGWMHTKLLLILILFGYFHISGSHLRRFKNGGTTRSPLFYRIYNETAVILLVSIVLLAIFRPF